MIFTELRFLALFAGCWACFAVVPRSWRSATLAVWGMAFYVLYAGPFLAVAFFLTVLAFASGRRLIAWVAGLTTVAVLAYFKLALSARLLDSALIPLGLSYLAFELLHVVIERRRGRLAGMTMLELLAFAFFAPARVAGPIKRFPDFTLAVRDAEPSAEDFYFGALRILGGLAKKFILADILSLAAAEVVYIDSPSQAWKVMFAYSLEIYFDFSAYSDIAIGFARILGIRLPENFNRPYFAPNIREFWDRWHITLSHWVRDYVFLPAGRTLFKTRLRPSPIAIATISYLLAFTIVGAWHGLSPSFLLWGIYHGILLSLYNVTRTKMPMSVARHPWYRSPIARGVGIAFTFVLVTIGWVPFMLPLHDASRILALMFGVHHS
jgi:alginate O-acetyltransferase complex protein AlgI